ncbi:MAG TPA: hypothetical protein VMG55_00260 [Stellaceae bacterium]|nr:hypothetical protein [Stellaceae bacterium]
MKSRGFFRVLGLGSLAAVVGATLLLTAPKAEAGTVVAVGVAPGYYAPYYAPYPYYPTYYAPAPVYPAPVFPFVGSVSFFFGPHGYNYGHGYYYGRGYHH